MTMFFLIKSLILLLMAEVLNCVQFSSVAARTAVVLFLFAFVLSMSL